MTDPEPGPQVPRSPVTLAELRRLDLAEEIAEVVAQVQRPRINLGGSSPPGRAD